MLSIRSARLYVIKLFISSNPGILESKGEREEGEGGGGGDGAARRKRKKLNKAGAHRDNDLIIPNGNER